MVCHLISTIVSIPQFLGRGEPLGQGPLSLAESWVSPSGQEAPGEAQK